MNLDRLLLTLARLFALIAIMLTWLFSSLAQGRDTDQAVCRIYNSQQNANDIGSGTLVSTLPSADGRKAGLVLTCHHLFRGGVGQITCVFPNGKTHYAKLLNGADSENDLAALEIAGVTQSPVRPVEAENLAGRYRACGYGSNGVFRCTTGTVAGQLGMTANGGGRVVRLVGDDIVRSGDSGGGVFDESGNLVAVAWGSSPGGLGPNGREMASRGTYATYGRPLSVFLAQYQVQVCRPGQPCGQQPRYIHQQPQQIARPAPKPIATPTQRCDCKSQFTSINKRVDSLVSLTGRIVGIAETSDASIKELVAINAEFNRRISALESTPAERGPAGQDGKDGRDGKDAVVDHEAIAQAAAQIVIANLPPQEVKPFHIRVHEDALYQPVKPGQYVTLPLKKLMQAQP